MKELKSLRTNLMKIIAVNEVNYNKEIFNLAKKSLDMANSLIDNNEKIKTCKKCKVKMIYVDKEGYVCPECGFTKLF